MKAFPLIALVLLAACAHAPAPQPTIPQGPLPDVITLDTILDDFAKLDTQLNTSWHDEAIPNAMIHQKDIKPWTDRLLALQEKSKDLGNQSMPSLLINARFEMLKAQVAYYLGAELQGKGDIAMERDGKVFKLTEAIDCDKKNDIIKETKLYAHSFAAWLAFNNYMDELLSNKEAQEKIGVNENKPAFYEPVFADARARLIAIVDGMKEQCDVTINLNDIVDLTQRDTNATPRREKPAS